MLSGGVMTQGDEAILTSAVEVLLSMSGTTSSVVSLEMEAVLEILEPTLAPLSTW